MDKEKRDFILKKGVLGIGLPVAFLMSVTLGFQVPGYLFKLQHFDPKIFVISLMIFVPLFMGAGYVWGLVVYSMLQKRKKHF